MKVIKFTSTAVLLVVKARGVSDDVSAMIGVSCHVTTLLPSVTPLARLNHAFESIGTPPCLCARSLAARHASRSAPCSLRRADTPPPPTRPPLLLAFTPSFPCRPALGLSCSALVCIFAEVSFFLLQLSFFFLLIFLVVPISSLIITISSHFTIITSSFALVFRGCHS